MKALFVHPSHPNQFTQIAHGLAREGWQCSFLVNEAFAAQVRQENPPISYFGFREEAAPLTGSYHTRSFEEGAHRGKAVAEAVAHLAASEGADVVLGHASFGVTFYLRHLLNIPVVSYVELPGYFPAYAREEFPALYLQSLLDISLRALIHTSVLHSDLCVVPSRYAKNLFPRELRPKVRVQMEGFTLPEPVTDRGQLRLELGLDPARPVVGFASRTLEAVRGFDCFVNAAKRIGGARPEAQLLVVGDEGTLYGNEAVYLNGKSFKQHALETGGLAEAACTFRSFMPHDQFVRHLQAMDLILFPLFEGAANWGLFEALAAGVPVLASNRCFIPEVIRHGREGLLFDPRDDRGFAEAALRLLAAPEEARHLGENGRRRIARRYSPEHARRGYDVILREALAIHRGGRTRAHTD
jgi:glycosyltransferase involved in cell wall biosynthesis